MRKHRAVAIVGAGVAGLSCAKELQKAGIAVTLFDKSRGPGGRMSTRRGEGWQCDHGAQFFTARHPAFRAEVMRWQAAGVAAVWQPQFTFFGGLNGHIPDAGIERFVGTPRMTSPARLLADSLDLNLQATVTELVREGDFWQLDTKESGRLKSQFDAVLLAVPAPQAVPLLEPVAKKLASFSEQALMRASWVLMAHYNHPPNLLFEAAFVNQGPLRWIARNNSKPGREGAEIWGLHATAEWSEAHIEETPEVVAEELFSAFAKLGAPLPATWTAHRWRYADSVPAMVHECIWDDALRLGLCGDWLNGGKVEGAWLGGHALGQQVTSFFAAA